MGQAHQSAQSTPLTGVSSNCDGNICKKCNGTGIVTKECEVKTINGGVIRYSINYLCECQQVSDAELFRKYSNLPPFEPKPFLDISRDYIMHYSEILKSYRNWIAFLGRTGVGKTTQAYMIVDSLLKRQNPVKCRVFYYPEIVRELSALRFKEDEYRNKIEQINEPEVIVFDDFLDVTPKEDSFEEQLALTLIKTRYVAKKPLIITSEMTPQNIIREMPRHGEALIGRIVEMCSKRISIARSDKTNYRIEKG